MKGMILYCD